MVSGCGRRRRRCCQAASKRPQHASMGGGHPLSCERLSRRDQSGVGAVADGILESLKIDPMLAAEMIYRSASPAWERIKETVIEYVGRWHTRGKVDRAVRFMITTGKPEFAPLLYLSSQMLTARFTLAAFRASERFRPMVLGEDVRGKLSELPDEIRDHIIAQFAWESGIDGMELAAEVAKTDPLPQVQFAVIEALQFRSCDRLVKEMLKTAPPTVWSLLAQKGMRGRFVIQKRQRDCVKRSGQSSRMTPTRCAA